MIDKTLLNRLYSCRKGRHFVRDLSRVRSLLALFDHPETKGRFIHVGGSNGKGTTAGQIAKSLELTGHKVGLFTSPHISSYRERFQINGRLIEEKEIASILTDIFKRVDEKKLNPSFFDITTCAAFLFFAHHQPDVTVIEVGMGGRADATNVMIPELAVITSISLEHTEILGSTIEEIAKEKAGIIKPYRPIVIGKSVPLSVIEPIAAKQKAPLFIAKDFPAKTALEVLGWPYDKKGLEFRLPCRFEEIVLPHGHYILDVAHNPDAIAFLFNRIKDHYPNRPIRCVFAASQIEKAAEMLAIIRRFTTAITWYQGAHKRLVPFDEAADFVDTLSDAVPISSHLPNAAQDDELIVICGSFFMMNEIRSLLGVSVLDDSL